ncbi:unnamed protein product [Heligmosomoides polygyrus]|uniref:EF-hand domain-containing protein n=1 Tax=Heligmosomoides polygyrus TaxID=6339 RepID=A0A183GBP0_HELPZ|nr:unnamed protein product [Heligmosomoides polygyrus]
MYDSIGSGGSGGGGSSGGWGGGGGGGSSVPSTRAPFSPKQIEDRFRDFDVDRRDGNNGGTGGEEVFEKVDWRQTTPSTRGGRNQGGQAEGREIELDG